LTADPVQLEAERLRRIIARRIAGLVNLRGEDRAKLAASIGTTETRISRVMKESSDLSAVELALAARHLKVPVGVLTGDMPLEDSMTRKR
jgi:hypothetical protein